MRVNIEYNAVVDTEVKLSAEIEMTEDEYYDFVLCADDIDVPTRTLQIDQITEIENEELNETLLNCTPDNLKSNCVSMTFTDVKVRKL